MKDLRSVAVAAAVVMVLVPVLVNAIVLVNCNFGCLSCCCECGCSVFLGLVGMFLCSFQNSVATYFIRLINSLSNIKKTIIQI